MYGDPLSWPGPAHAAVTLDSTYFNLDGPTTRGTPKAAGQCRGISTQNRTWYNYANRHTQADQATIRPEKARATNASTTIHSKGVRAISASKTIDLNKARTNAFTVLSEDECHKRLNQRIANLLLKGAGMQKGLNRSPADTWKRTPVHQPSRQPEWPKRGKATVCRMATADWQIATAIRRTMQKPRRRPQMRQAVAKKLPATGANAIPIGQGRPWGQK